MKNRLKRMIVIYLKKINNYKLEVNKTIKEINGIRY